jgi:hypothetical protein
MFPLSHLFDRGVDKISARKFLLKMLSSHTGNIESKRLNESFSEEELKRFPLFAPLAILRSRNKTFSCSTSPRPAFTDSKNHKSL